MISNKLLPQHNLQWRMESLAGRNAGLTMPFTSVLPQQVAPSNAPITSPSRTTNQSSTSLLTYLLLEWLTELPEALVRQLKPGGRMVIPVGTNSQVILISRTPVHSFTYSPGSCLNGLSSLVAAGACDCGQVTGRDGEEDQRVGRPLRAAHLMWQRIPFTRRWKTKTAIYIKSHISLTRRFDRPCAA
jgi:hypothetical protein